eukprot:scpid39855/ scgid29596/ 
MKSDHNFPPNQCYWLRTLSPLVCGAAGKLVDQNDLLVQGGACCWHRVDVKDNFAMALSLVCNQSWNTCDLGLVVQDPGCCTEECPMPCPYPEWCHLLVAERQWYEISYCLYSATCVIK